MLEIKVPRVFVALCRTSFPASKASGEVCTVCAFVTKLELASALSFSASSDVYVFFASASACALLRYFPVLRLLNTEAGSSQKLRMTFL